MAIIKAVNNKCNNPSGLKNLLNYVLQIEKTNQRLVTSLGDIAINDEDITPATIYDEFIRIKEHFDKKGNHQYQHFVLSFPPNNEITPELALQFSHELADHLWADNFQILCAIHTDCSHIHCHYVINSVSYVDGHMFHTSRYDLKSYKNFLIKQCNSWGLSVPEKGKHYDMSPIEEGEIISNQTNKYRLLVSGKKSYLSDCAIAIVEAKSHATSKESFIKEMSSKGWTVIWSDNKKHLTFVDKKGHKVRDTNIEKTFNIITNKEWLLNEFARRKEYEESIRSRNIEISTGASNKKDINPERTNIRTTGEAKQYESRPIIQRHVTTGRKTKKATKKL